MNNDNNKREWYEILGVSPTALEPEIKSAYRKLSIQYHPDQNPGNKLAEERFKEISGAYDVYVRLYGRKSNNSEPEPPQQHNEQDSQKSEVIFLDAVKIIYNAAHIMAIKANGDFVVVQNAFIKYMETGADRFFTRDNNCRYEIVTHLSPEKMRAFFEQKFPADHINISVMMFISRVLLNDEKTVEESILEKAIAKTIIKYDVDWATRAIYGLINHNNYNGFTNDYNARHDLINNVQSKDIMNIIKNSMMRMGFDDSYISIESYIDIINSSISYQSKTSM